MSGCEREFKMMDVAGFSVYWDTDMVGEEEGDKLAVSDGREGGGEGGRWVEGRKGRMEGGREGGRMRREEGRKGRWKEHRKREKGCMFLTWYLYDI